MSYDLFRDNDNVGDASSFWYRATRLLFEKQSPIPKMTCLTVGANTDEQLPIGLFTFTDNKRLVFWPAMGKSETMQMDSGASPVFDHITLEFPKQKFHLTAYDQLGQKVKVAQSLGTYRFPDADSSMWLQVLAKCELLRGQDSAIQRKIKVSDGQKNRLVGELKKFVENLTFQKTFLPVSNDNDYVCYTLFLTSNALALQNKLTSGDLVNQSFLSRYVDRWESEQTFQIVWSQFRVAEHDLCIAAACPPGTMRIPVAFQFPRRSSGKASG